MDEQDQDQDLSRSVSRCNTRVAQIITATRRNPVILPIRTRIGHSPIRTSHTKKFPLDIPP